MKLSSEHLLQKMASVIFIIFPLTVFAINQSSVITLEFPAGSENTGLAESGVSLSNSINTMFWNPAALPAVYDNLQTRIHTGFFIEHPLNLKEIDHRYYTGALFFNDLLPKIDIAYGFYNNKLQMNGYNQNVFSNCIGVRVFDMISLGISIKAYRSEITDYSSNQQFKSKGFTYDLGTRFEYTSQILSTPITISPEVGLSIVNLGNDSALEYVEKRPLPKGLYIGSSVTTGFLEFFGYTMTAEARASFVKSKTDSVLFDGTDYKLNGGHDLVVSLSNKFQITPFYSYGFGYMVDYNGGRFEFHDAHTITFDARKLMTLIYRIKRRDLEPESKNVKSLHEKLSFYGGKIKPNIRFSYSTSNINSLDGDARDGQKGIDFSLGF